jgi:hypothetical protein
MKQNFHILFCFIVFMFTFTCIHYFATHNPTSSRTCSALLFSDFVGEKNIKDNKKNMQFLLVWDKDSYTGRFFVFTCICVLQPILVHLYRTSSLLPSPLPIVALATLRWLYSFLYSENINHIQVFGLLPLPHPSCAWSHLSVGPVSNNITAFVLGL